MSILLLFPILMVGISSFANDEQTVTVTETNQYETNEVNSVNDLVIGNIYELDIAGSFPSDIVSNGGYVCIQYIYGDFSYSFTDASSDEIYLEEGTILNNQLRIYFYANGNMLLQNDLGDNDYVATLLEGVNFQSGFYGVLLGYDLLNDISYGYFLPSDYLGQVTTNVDIQNATYKQEINNWCNGFKNLPVNQWYGQLLNVIGVGQTTNSVMNVIYVYPLYVLWVYLIDLIVDCLLVIIHFGHNALSRLGGDND